MQPKNDMGYIPYGKQEILSRDIAAVVKALKSDFITQGPKVAEFEDSLCRYTGAAYAVAVSSGTAALHLSMLALGLQNGDGIVTSPITFSASANCALYVGAMPSFVDIDDETCHLDLDKLKNFLKINSIRKKIKVVIPVHFMGTVLDVVELKKICDKYGIGVVEDAAHALGAMYKSSAASKWIKVGGCKHSDAAIFSFHPIKHITTGEGGAILTNNKTIYEKALRLRHHGIVKKSKHYWEYDIAEIGFNYRITDFQSALGISQLKRINSIVEKRREIVGIYNDSLSQIKELRLLFEREESYGSYHLYVIRIAGGRRDQLYDYLRKNNIYTQINYIPVHLLSYYRRNFGYKLGDFPTAEKYFTECLSLPLYPGLSRLKQAIVIKQIKKFFGYRDKDK